MANYSYFDYEYFDELRKYYFDLADNLRHIRYYFNTVFSLIGLIGNCISSLIWGLDSKKNSSAFLMMFLAISDTMYCIFNILNEHVLYRQLTYRDELRKLYLYLLYIPMVNSTFATAYLAFTRWLVVYKPTTNNTCLKLKTSIIFAVASSTLSILLVVVPESISGDYRTVSEYIRYVEFNLGFSIFARVVPVIFMIIFSISLIILIVKQNR